MSARDELLRACARGDELALQRAGWTPVWEALSSWWPKAFSSTDLRPYVALLVDEPPELILGALQDWTRTKSGQWRPKPAELAHLLRPDDEPGTVNVGRGHGCHRSDEALAAVAAALAAGEQPCRCGHDKSRYLRQSPSKYHPRQVWRCRDCRGLEPGQVHAVEDQHREQATA